MKILPAAVFVLSLIAAVSAASAADQKIDLPPPPAESGNMNVAVLQGLDKITARITTIDAPVGQTVRFGTLDILVKRCVKSPPEDPPENTAYLDITEQRQGEPDKTLFSGWMFSSSPAVSSIQHPVYDVWVVSCKNASSSSGESSTGKPADTSRDSDSLSR